jgi:NitT/TauT family transport system substrate-binding protein
MLILTGCTENNPPQISIGTNVWPGYETLYLGREKGYYQNLNVKLVEYRSASQVIDGLQRGLIDMAALTLDEVIKVKSHGTPLKIILIFDISHGADALISAGEYDSINKLKGKRIGIEQSALGAYFFQRFIDVNQLKRDDFQLKGLDIDAHLQAMERQEVDAVVTFEPVKSKILRRGGHVLFDSSDIPNEIIDVLVITDVAYQRIGQEALQTFFNQYWKVAVSFINSPKQSYQLINKRLKLSSEELTHTYQQLHIPDIKEQLIIMSPTGLGQKTVNKYNEILFDMGIIEQRCDCAALFDSSFIEAIE